jgi:hypothetical protein
MLKALLRRVADGGIGVVVHKIDRLAGSIEDHVAIRAARRHANVQLVSVTESIEETGLSAPHGGHPRADGRVLLGEPAR